MVRKCELLRLPRSSAYYEAVPESMENLRLMKRIDKLYLARQFFGSRRMSLELEVNRKRVQRLMRLMGMEAVYAKPRTTRSSPEHQKYPYLLRDVKVERVDQVWSSDITYIPMARGYLYLTVVMDWFSRCVLSWRLSNSLEGSFCVEALEAALGKGRPEIFNTDQGVQYTSREFTRVLEDRGVRISMDGKGRALDNVFVERLWRSVKQEEVYLKSYADGWEAERELGRYFRFYNGRRRHQSLKYQTPAAVYASGVL
jgi:putative transposase